jgi:RNA polymerase sigma factor (TIGR02999 family)
MEEITVLLGRARCGDGAAWNQVVGLLYTDLLRLARRAGLGGRAQTLNATALVNECYLRMAKSGVANIHDRAHFLAIAGRAMRQILVNHARDRVVAKRGSGAVHTTLEHLERLADQEAQDLLEMDSALQDLEQQDERLVRVVDCRIFGGLSEAETAQALQIPLRSVQRLWSQARERLQMSLAG